MSASPQLLAWSHSRVEDYRKCPYMLYHKAVLKDVPFKQTPQMAEGERIHKALEFKVRDGTPMPAKYSKYEPLAASIANAPGHTLCEYKITLDAGLRSTGWFSPDAWLRVIIDVMKINGDVGFMGDYKTGQSMKFNEHQLKLFAAAGFIAFPQVNKWTTAYIWTEFNVLDPAVYTRDQFPEIWKELMVTPDEMQRSYVMNHWPAKTGHHCKWCDVNKAGKCEFASEKPST